MTRREAREQAFMLIFEKSFHDLPIEEIIEQATEDRDIQVEAFAHTLVCGVVEHQQAVDSLIGENLKNWKMDRLSRVVLAILRMSVYEMLHLQEIPVSVTINEAVEIAKKYATQEDAGFINGILGAIADKEEQKAKEAVQ